MEQKQIQYVLIAVALIVALVGSYFGIKLPAPDVPEPTSRAANVPCYFEQGGAAFTCGSGGTVTIGSGGTLAVASGATETHAGTVTFSSAPTINNNATITGALTLGGATMSGPVRFGSASTVVTGTTIAHGLATTPTMAVLTAGIPITTPLYITARNATSITVGINDAVSVDTVFWIAGK